MRILINNIGHVDYADIDVNSITVIAGNNNTGKSTVGKALYATATGLTLLEPLKILEEKAEAVVQRLSIITRLVELDLEDELIFREIRRYCLSGEYFEQFGDALNADENLFSESSFSMIDVQFSEFLLEKINKLFSKLTPKVTEGKSVVLADVKVSLDKLLQKSINDKNFKVNIMQKVFNMEFYKQISHLNELDKDSSITVKELNQNEININFKEHKIQLEKTKLDTSRPFSKAIYIDNPFVLDNPLVRHTRVRNQYAHTQVLRNMLISHDVLGEHNLFELDDREDQIEEIFQHIMHEGKVVWKDGNHYFKNSLIKSPLYFENLSTGLKSFSIMYMLLKSNNLDECEYIILDEPEIHLHPDWQLKFAELMVLISKKFSLKLIITSHSPYFVEAIELYAKKHDYFSDVRFYRTRRSPDGLRYVIENVTNNIKNLYDDLANAFYSLEELRDQVEEDMYDD